MFWPSYDFPGLRFHAYYNPVWQKVQVYTHSPDGFGLPLVIEADDFTRPKERAPFLSLVTDEVQGLMDALWAAGVRPSIRGSVDSVVAAKDDHIGDLRKVIFGKE